MRKVKRAVLLMAVAGMALGLTGCRMYVNTEDFGLSDISYADLEKYTPGAAELPDTVERIEINWPVGSVTVKPHNADTVSFSEESARELTDDTRLHYWLDGVTLRIQFCRAGKWRLEDMEKELTVLTPKDLALAELKVSGLSANLNLDRVQTDRLTISNISGNMRLTGGSVKELASISTISGGLEAEFDQPLEKFDGNSTSGSFQISAPAIEKFSSSTISGPVSLSVGEAPKALDMQTTSGNIDLALPGDAAFTLDYDATSGDLSSDLPFTMEGGRYIFGNGTGEYEIGAISGDVRIAANE